MGGEGTRKEGYCQGPGQSVERGGSIILPRLCGFTLDTQGAAPVPPPQILGQIISVNPGKVDKMLPAFKEAAARREDDADMWELLAELQAQRDPPASLKVRGWGGNSTPCVPYR